MTREEQQLREGKKALACLEHLESAASSIFDRAEALASENAFPDLASCRIRLESEPRSRTLGIILCLPGEENYEEALKRIEENLSQGETGGFSRLGGRRSILEDARDYCAARMAAQP